MSRGHLLAAPDKFRGTATSGRLATAAAAAAVAAGWTATALPLADGGEGLLDALGGARHRHWVTGPLGDPVEAEWAVLSGSRPLTAVIEMATASGIGLVGGAEGNDPWRATTRGTGELVLRAIESGAERVVVGCGGSATTDGGEGALEAIGGPGALSGVDVVVACDVRTAFGDAARVFGPQKGAGPDQVRVLTERLADLVVRYRERFGVDVSVMPGAGAAGGLAGGLAAIGARIAVGFDLVAELVGLEPELARSQLVVTGEGRLDRTSLEGKAVVGVLARLAGRAPALVVVGQSEGVSPAQLAGAAGIAPALVAVVSLAERFGIERAMRQPVELFAEVVGESVA